MCVPRCLAVCTLNGSSTLPCCIPRRSLLCLCPLTQVAELRWQHCLATKWPAKLQRCADAVMLPAGTRSCPMAGSGLLTPSLCSPQTRGWRLGLPACPLLPSGWCHAGMRLRLARRCRRLLRWRLWLQSYRMDRSLWATSHPSEQPQPLCRRRPCSSSTTTTTRPCLLDRRHPRRPSSSRQPTLAYTCGGSSSSSGSGGSSSRRLQTSVPPAKRPGQPTSQRAGSSRWCRQRVQRPRQQLWPPWIQRRRP